MPVERVTIVGANGFIGGILCPYLRARTYRVDTISSLDGGMNPATGCLREDVSVPQGTTAVIYLSQAPVRSLEARDWQHVVTVQELNAVRLACVAATVGATRFIYASSGNVYAPSFLPLHERSPVRRDDMYSLAKLHAEEKLTLLHAEIDVHLLRLFTVYGPGQRSRLIPQIVQRMRSGQAVILERNEADEFDTEGLKLSACYVHDLCSVIERIVQEGGPPVLNVASDELLSIKAIADEIGLILSTTATFVVGGYRPGNLLADTSALVSSLRPTFTPFSLALRQTLSNEEPSSPLGRQS